MTQRSSTFQTRTEASSLRIPPVGYLHETSTTERGDVIHHFIVVIPPGPGLEALSAAGHYSSDELLAREDGAAALAGMMLRAFNIINYDLSNDLLEEARDRNDKLHSQNSQINREYMNYRDDYPYDARESSNSSEEYYLP
ncbi:hypothetical protein PIB30_016116 [Stylosanthes scabra]|uniref:Uncharacterized protein n=1 Tax=Stylosanthes scabra TaxID=79078 RepID=A0ABU6R7H8_9FABA|nr:hypothetical protein [Stylosanthes scabra]